MAVTDILRGGLGVILSKLGIQCIFSCFQVMLFAEISRDFLLQNVWKSASS